MCFSYHAHFAILFWSFPNVSRDPCPYSVGAPILLQLGPHKHSQISQSCVLSQCWCVFSRTLLPLSLFRLSNALSTAELEAALIRVAPLTFGAMSLGFSFIFSVTIVVNQSTALFFCNSMRFRTLLAAFATLQLNLWPPNACVV